MIRVLIYLVIVAVLAFGAVWLAERPGDVVITWQGERVETSVMVLMAAAAAVAVAAVLLWSIARAIVGSPDAVSRFLRNRRGVRAYQAVSHGLIAVGSGDARAARKFTADARRIAPNEPLTLLLSAQAAQLAGNRDAAAATFQQMAERDDTKVLGLHGLFVEARRRNDPAAALFYAEEAAKESAVPPWAGQAVLEFRCRAGDWEGALTVLESHRRSGMIGRDGWRRLRAVLLTARAISAEDEERDIARARVLEAVKLAPGLVPAAELAGRMLAEAGERRKAGKIIETAWKLNPHPDLADGYAHVRLADSARDRLSRVEALARMAPGHPESALAVARAALDAREFTVVRRTLEPLIAEPTQRVAVLMAELERLEGDEGRAREWMGRAFNAARDPAWTADGYVSERWLPVSPVTGMLDAFQWKVPVADIGERPPMLIEAAAPPEPDAMPAPRAEAALPPQVPSPPLGNIAPEPPSPPPGPSARPAARVAPIIPLTQVPDDPGPQGDDADPDARPAGWQRIRQIFR
jgi:HemY protein